MSVPTIDAGDFGAWLRQMQSGEGADVPCGACNACCRASYFIHVAPADGAALNKIPQALLFPAPGRPPGHKLMGYNAQGECPMLSDGRCSIYSSRPQTCRDYDCRIFAAAGIPAGGDEKAAVNRQVLRWRFSFRNDEDKQTNAAVRAAARFLTEQAHRLTPDRRPANPTQLALLAIELRTLFAAADSLSAEALAERVNAYIENRMIEGRRMEDRPPA